MASIKLAYGTPVTLTLTSANLANSPTAGWQSDVQDNSSNLYLDALVQVTLAAVNTAPANNKAINLYGYAEASGGTAYTGTGDTNASGSVGTITFPDITANIIPAPLVGNIPYPVQNKAINSSAFSIARAFGGILPSKYGILMINYTGMTLNVTAIKITPVYATVA